MPKYEVTVKTPRGIFSYATNQPKEQYIPTVLNKHKYDKIENIKFSTRIKS